MQPEMTPQEIANEIGVRQIQSRIYGEGETFVMVEGRTDEVLWEEFRSRNDCTLYPSYGKDKIVDALGITKKRGMNGVAGIIDADYWLITDADELGTDNLLYDDCCPDMEVILLQSPALKKVLRHELPGEDIDAVHAFADALNHESQRLAAEIGYFRWLNEVEGYGLNFKALRLADFIDAETRTLDCDWLARRLAEGRDGISSERLLSETAELRANHPPENPQLCRGKDVLAIMAQLLPALYQARFGEEPPENIRELFQDRRLAKELRKAYEFIYFMRTSLFGCIQNWENTNSPYKILKPEI